MQSDIYNILTDFRNEMNNRFDTIEDKFVSIDRFKPVENLVYGMAGFVLLAVLGAMVSFFIVRYSPTQATMFAREITPIVQAIGGS